MYRQLMTLQLNIHHYETIVAIVELGTMTAAARELNSTQSTLSHRLAEAERRLGVQLFDRGRQRRLTPTRAGLATHQAASRALAGLKRNEQALLADRAAVTSVVRIAVGSYDCYHWFPELLARTRDHYPEIDLDLVVVGDEPGPALASGAADLVIAPGLPRGNVTNRFLFDDELMLVTSPSHEFADRAWIAAGELEGQTYLTYNSAPTPGFEYDRFIWPSGTYPRMVTVVEQTSAITELVAAGAGVSILSKWALGPAVEAGRVATVSCGAEGLPLAWHAVLRSEEPPGSAPNTVADLLAEHLQAVSSEVRG